MWLLVSPHGKDDQEDILGIVPRGLIKDACPLVDLYHRCCRQTNVKIKCVLKLDINKRNCRTRGKERKKKRIYKMFHVCASF
jgi:hypothetical protein